MLQSIFSNVNQSRISLKDAIKQYWKNYLGFFFFFPALTGIEVAGIDDGITTIIITVLFFSSAIYAIWPYLRKDAPFMFWVVACGVWITSPIFWTIIVSIAKLSFGSHLEDA